MLYINVEGDDTSPVVETELFNVDDPVRAGEALAGWMRDQTTAIEDGVTAARAAATGAVEDE